MKELKTYLLLQTANRNTENQPYTSPDHVNSDKGNEYYRNMSNIKFISARIEAAINNNCIAFNIVFKCVMDQ